MTAPAEPSPNMLRVACAQCGRELRPKRELAGKRVRCPDCKATVAIPAMSKGKPSSTGKRQAAASPPAAKQPPQPGPSRAPADAGTKRPSSPGTAKAKSSPPSKPDTFGDDFFESALRGPVAAADPAPPADKLTDARSPARSANAPPAVPERDPFAPPAPPPDREAFDLNLAPAPPIEAVPSAYPRRPVEADDEGDGPKLPVAYHRAKAAQEETERAAAPPPEWPFFSGVFTYLFQPNVALQWLKLTGYGMVTVLLFFPASAYGQIAGVTFGMVIISLTLWTVSYAAACLLPIIEQTAHGIDEIEFPELAVLERVVPFGYLVFLVSVSLAIGSGIGWGLGLLLGPSIRAFIALPSAYLVFPFLLLSVLEAGSIWQPISGPVARSLVTQTRGWIVFHALTGGMLAMLGLVTLGGLVFAPVTTTIIGAPLWAAWWLLYARLLGRLAWLATREQEDRDEQDE